MMPVFPKFLKPGLFTAIAVNNPGLRPNKNHTNNNEPNLLSVDQYQCFVKWHIITHDIEKIFISMREIYPSSFMMGIYQSYEHLCLKIVFGMNLSKARYGNFVYKQIFLVHLSKVSNYMK